MTVAMANLVAPPLGDASFAKKFAQMKQYNISHPIAQTSSSHS